MWHNRLIPAQKGKINAILFCNEGLSVEKVSLNAQLSHTLPASTSAGAHPCHAGVSAAVFAEDREEKRLRQDYKASLPKSTG